VGGENFVRRRPYCGKESAANSRLNGWRVAIFAAVSTPREREPIPLLQTLISGRMFGPHWTDGHATVAGIVALDPIYDRPPIGSNRCHRSREPAGDRRLKDDRSRMTLSTD
jgi:hypothetical protein